MWVFFVLSLEGWVPHVPVLHVGSFLLCALCGFSVDSVVKCD